jgi:FMN reductase
LVSAAVIATGVYAAAEDWGTGGVAADGGLVERIDRAAAELAAAMALREHQPTVDRFADPVPFEQVARTGPIK